MTLRLPFSPTLLRIWALNMVRISVALLPCANINCFPQLSLLYVSTDLFSKLSTCAESIVRATHNVVGLLRVTLLHRTPPRRPLQRRWRVGWAL